VNFLNVQLSSSLDDVFLKSHISISSLLDSCIEFMQGYFIKINYSVQFAFVESYPRLQYSP
jgi:hypothetical protein